MFGNQVVMGGPFKVVTVMMVLSLLRVKQTVMMVDVELLMVTIILKVVTIIEVLVMVTVTINSYASFSICVYSPLLRGCLLHVSMFLSCRLQACYFQSECRLSGCRRFPKLRSCRTPNRAKQATQ